jgi:hypothetical protein
MQKIIDFYFLIISSIICLYLLICCFYNISWTMLIIVALSIMLALIHILNVFKPSLISRKIVKYITLIVCIATAIFMPLFMIIATYRYEILLYLVIAFCILNIVLILCMRTETQKSKSAKIGNS